MRNLHSPGQNRLLAALPLAEYQRLSPHLELVGMSFGDVLCRSGDALRHAYFPTSALVSVQYVTEAGASAEIATVGNEGMLGVALFTGGDSMPHLATVQCPGHGYRLKAQLLKDEFNRSGALQILLLNYTQALITQMSQIAVCNRHHTVEQQLCRWLLSRLDQSPSNEIHATHELIAGALGVRREGVTVAAGKLQHAGLIGGYRGCIVALDRSGLEKRACECYEAVRKEYDRLLPDAAQPVETRRLARGAAGSAAASPPRTYRREPAPDGVKYRFAPR